MSDGQFQLVFPIIILIFYLFAKIYVDNKNNKSSWQEELAAFPLDIIFLGIAFVGGAMTKTLQLSLLGAIIIIALFLFCFLVKILSNLSIDLLNANKNWKAFWAILINYILSIAIVIFLFWIYL